MVWASEIHPEDVVLSTIGAAESVDGVFGVGEMPLSKDIHARCLFQKKWSGAECHRLFVR